MGFDRQQWSSSKFPRGVRVSMRCAVCGVRWAVRCKYLIYVVDINVRLDNWGPSWRGCCPSSTLYCVMPNVIVTEPHSFTSYMHATLRLGNTEDIFMWIHWIKEGAWLIEPVINILLDDRRSSTNGLSGHQVSANGIGRASTEYRSNFCWRPYLSISSLCLKKHLNGLEIFILAVNRNTSIAVKRFNLLEKGKCTGWSRCLSVAWLIAISAHLVLIPTIYSVRVIIRTFFGSYQMHRLLWVVLSSSSGPV